MLEARKLLNSTSKTCNHEISSCFDVMARSYCSGLLNALTCSRCGTTIRGEQLARVAVADVQFDDWLSHDCMFSALRTKATSRPSYDVAGLGQLYNYADEPPLQWTYFFLFSTRLYVSLSYSNLFHFLPHQFLQNLNFQYVNTSLLSRTQTQQIHNAKYLKQNDLRKPRPSVPGPRT
jgi:hypothetical protein